MTLARGKNLNGYVIFKHPASHPDKYVVRIRRMMGDEGVLDATPVHVADTLDEARSAVQNTDCLICLPRGPRDEANVVETWL